jgi:hypothetical protein
MSKKQVRESVATEAKAVVLRNSGGILHKKREVCTCSINAQVVYSQVVTRMSRAGRQSWRSVRKSCTAQTLEIGCQKNYGLVGLGLATCWRQYLDEQRYNRLFLQHFVIQSAFI